MVFLSLLNFESIECSLEDYLCFLVGDVCVWFECWY